MRLDVKVFKTQCKKANLYSAEQNKTREKVQKRKVKPTRGNKNTHTQYVETSKLNIKQRKKNQNEQQNIAKPQTDRTKGEEGKRSSTVARMGASKPKRQRIQRAK